MKFTYLVIGAIATTLYLASCEKDQVQSSQFNQTEASIATDSTQTKNDVKITFTELPTVLKDYLVTKYKAYEIVEAYKGLDSKGLVVYKLKIKVDGKLIEVKFDASGKVIEEVKTGPVLGALKESDLTAEVRKYLSEKYPNYKFISGNKFQTTVTTMVNIKISTVNGDVHLMFDGASKLIQAVEIPIIMEIKEADLTPAIAAYLKTNYPAYKFVTARKESKASSVAYFVKIKDTKGTLELTFDAAGKLIASSQNGLLSTPITSSQLLPAMTDYIKLKYPNYTFVSAKKINKGTLFNYEVTLKDLTSTVELKFDDKGNVTSVSKIETKSIPMVLKESDLSAPIKAYLTAKYPGYTFISGITKQNDKKESITSIIIKKNNGIYEVKFNAKGEFVSVSGNDKVVIVPIKTTDLPADIQTYLKANYPKGEVVSIAKTTKSDVTTYVLVVKIDNKKVELTFDGKGKFISKKD